MKLTVTVILLVHLPLLLLSACGSSAPTELPVDLEEDPPTFFYFYTDT